MTEPPEAPAPGAEATPREDEPESADPSVPPDETESIADRLPLWILALIGLVVAGATLGGWVLMRRFARSAAVRAAARAPAPGIRYAHAQAQGGRKRQEDDLGHSAGESLDPEGDHPFFLVADGMGGHAAGDVASRVAVRGFFEAYGNRGPVRDRLQAALDRANAAIVEDLERNPNHGGMGTTLVVAAVTSEGLHWISVGDSALYLYRDGRLERLNDDHSMRPVIAMWEKEDPAFAATLNPNELRSVLMGGRIPQTDLCAAPRSLRAGDIVVLATDGLETLSTAEVASAIAANREAGPQRICRALLEAVDARQHPYQDNTTLYAVEIEADSAGATEAGAPAVTPPSDRPTEPPERLPPKTAGETPPDESAPSADLPRQDVDPVTEKDEGQEDAR